MRVEDLLNDLPRTSAFAVSLHRSTESGRALLRYRKGGGVTFFDGLTLSIMGGPATTGAEDALLSEAVQDEEDIIAEVLDDTERSRAQ